MNVNNRAKVAIQMHGKLCDWFGKGLKIIKKKIKLSWELVIFE